MFLGDSLLGLILLNNLKYSLARQDFLLVKEKLIVDVLTLLLDQVLKILSHDLLSLLGNIANLDSFNPLGFFLLLPHNSLAV